MANVFNSVLLFGLLIYFGRKPLAEGLKKRKARIVAGMDEAARMKREAAGRLEEYEEKLKRIDEEIERVRSEMRAAAEAERQRILAEAKERRIRMERDAKLLVEQELKAAHELLLRQAVTSAIKSAEDILKKELSSADHDRLANDYLGMVKSAPVVKALGGKA
jgi:F-type H+-transporting ATPase subunit b